MARNAKANGAKEVSKGSQQQQTQQQQKQQAEVKAKKVNAKKTVEVKQPARRGFFGGLFRLLFTIAYYVTLSTLAASTIAILMNCGDGGKNIPGSKPLCADLTKVWNFQKPSPLFLTNVKNGYATVLNGYNRQLQPYIAPVTKEVNKYWKQFSKTPIGKQVESYFYKVHAWVVEKLVLIQRFVQKKHAEIVAWYNKDGHKQIGVYVKGFKTGLLMVYEVVKDVVLQIAAGITYIYQRGQLFVNKWIEGGLQAALKTLN